MDLSSIKIIPILDTLKLETISDDVYFSEKYSEYISNSRLGLLKREGPKAFFEGLSSNKIYSDALLFGSAVHELVLQPESFFIVEEVDRPTAKAGFMADYLYKKDGSIPTDDEIIEASNKINYYKDKMDEKKISSLIEKCKKYWEDRANFENNNTDTRIPIFLDSRNKERLNSCITALNKNRKIQELLHPKGLIEDPIVENEKTILLDVEMQVPEKESFVFRLKSKLDNFTIDKDSNTITVNDVKTTGKMVNMFNEAISNFSYDREMGMYSWLLGLCASEFFDMKNPKIKSNFLVVSTIPQYYTKVVPMSKSWFKSGFSEFKELLRLAAYYKVNGYEV